jgi:hypothetical protein
LVAVHFGWRQASLDGERVLGVLPEAAAIAIFAMTYLVAAVGRLPGFWLDRAGLAFPVSPVLSGRDQASATPSIAISDPLTGARHAGRVREYGNYKIIYLSGPLQGSRAPP